LKISLIGAGNVAWHLAQLFEKNNHTILEIYSRDLSNSEKLSRKLLCTQATDDLNFSKSKAELFVIALADDALEDCISMLKIPEECIVAHTSGSQPIAVLKNLPNPKGVFYPLQTFSKHKEVNLAKSVLCIEGSDKPTEQILLQLANEISKNVRLVNSAQRKILHIAAVFACNFTNHLLTISQEILEKENAPFDLMKPLILETIEKALKTNPKSSQTGPAVRKDKQIIQTHMEYLKEDKDKQAIYQLLTDSIEKMYK
jgi:predicted short-subunit dehydrogenase-like oxidoreductase (DUF2520 family)